MTYMLAGVVSLGIFSEPIIASGAFFSFDNVHGAEIGEETQATFEVPIARDPLSNETSFIDPILDTDETTLIAYVGPEGTQADILPGEIHFDVDDVTTYTVREGDTLGDIAGLFNISQTTILWQNNLSKGAKLKPGMELIILPIDGYEAKVERGDTLSSLAKKYSGSVDEIMEFNHIESSKDLKVGQEVFIPGGQKPAPKPVSTTSTSTKSSGSSSSYSFTGSFGRPVNGRVTSNYGVQRGSRVHRGIDFGATTGTPIYAVADGVVTTVRHGYGGGFGNHVIVNHGNGMETLSAHMSRTAVEVGQRVKKGQLIGYVGSTGNSTGPHLHFEVHINGRAVNPATYFK